MDKLLANQMLAMDVKWWYGMMMNLGIAVLEVF